MKHPRQLLRVVYINYIIARRGLDQVLFSRSSLSSFRFLAYFNPWNWFRPANYSRGLAIRLALEQLGPVFVKFGQILSTRPDLLPEDIIVELEKLQDQVPPFSETEALLVAEKTFGCPLSQIFSEFSLTPLASASIAQVHAATLVTGQEVVVKIQRPNIVKTIQRDIGLLYTIAGLTEKFWRHGRRLRPKELVAEFERSIINELDFTREAASGSQLRRNFQDSRLLYVPEIFWDYTSPTIIVMERIAGIPVTDKLSLEKAGINLKKIAERGVEIFFTQVFRDSFFHADMHPGNIFISTEHPQDPQYLAVDFGIMGTLSPNDQHYLAQNFLAFFRRDYRQVAVLHIESGWVPPQTRIEEFEAAIRSVCEPIFNKPLRDISFAHLLLRLFQTASQFKMEIQPQLLLLQKTLFNIEGLGRKLYPDLDLWTTAKPFLERSVRKRYSKRVLLKQVMERMPSLINDLMVLPELARTVLEQEKKQQVLNEWRERTVVEYPAHKKNSGTFFIGVATTLLATAGLSMLLGGEYTLPAFWYKSLVVASAASLLISLLLRKNS